ncbi:MAG: type 2 isopentenyl-diphosphate Delta-isomerase [Hyphomicrobiaceae bacterium]|nr:type 2 isopentenyl-diphosphate Delta-isomerase [Hyphomicrobiaceae bacterium]
MSGAVQAQTVTTGFEAVRFEHVAAPEIDCNSIDLTMMFLGRRLKAPFLISSMTGGPSRSAGINLALAEAAEVHGLALAVGSQRIALEGAGDGGITRDLRRLAPSVPILGNMGAAQLRGTDGPDLARQAVEMIGADALIVHLNPVQEAVQSGGDRDWTGVLAGVERVVRGLTVPVVVKEVGCGISGGLARRLMEAGVAAIDVAGAGGTSWAAVEAERAGSSRERDIAAAFRDWGIPTAQAVAEVRAACPGAVLIASGGLKTGIDAAKAIRLGADLAGFAAGILPAAVDSTEALVARFDVLIEQLRISCFATGSADLAALRRARLTGGP